jgi:hypothetical protein
MWAGVQQGICQEGASIDDMLAVVEDEQELLADRKSSRRDSASPVSQTQAAQAMGTFSGSVMGASSPSRRRR